MKQTLLLVLCAFLTFSAKSQIFFSEDFDGISGPTAGGAGTYTFPGGWLLRNVDNATPAGSVSYVNEAWERREDFGANVADSVAFSTSWYSPANTANDWMWSPLVNIPSNAVLKWDAKSYDPMYLEGYEVRIMSQSSTPGGPTGGTGVIGNQITASTQVFSIAAEGNAWATHQVSLAAYAGQSIWVGFRNISNDKFILVIDDVIMEQQINSDLKVTAAAHGEYTVLTSDNATTPANFQLSGTLNNSGLLPMPNVALGCQVWVDGSLVTTVSSSTDPSLANGASVTKTITYSPTVVGDYTFKFFPISTTPDLYTANDTLIDATPFSISTSYLGRDNGVIVGALGIGAGNGGVLGNVFNIETTTQFSGVDVSFTHGYATKQLALAVYNTNGSGVPTTLLTTTDTLLYIDDSARTYFLPFNNGLSLAPGKYGFLEIEFDSTLSVAQTSAIFTNNTVYVNWPTSPFGGFSAIEAFGASFAKSFAIRPKKDICFGEIGGTLDSTGLAGCGISDGYAAINLDAGYSITWEDNSTNPVNSALPVGYSTYTMDNGNCTFVDSVLIANATAPSATLTNTTDALCNGDNGSLTIDITGGTAPYSILWSDGNTTLTLNEAAGTYSVTVTDDNNCVVSLSNLTIMQPTAVVVNASGTDETCVDCNDGTAEVSVSGGTPAYTYSWNPTSATTDSIGDLAPGTYTVTIQDDNGCTSTGTYSVVEFIGGGLSELAQIGINVYPNPVVDLLTIESSNQTIQKVTVYDASGKMIATGINSIDFRKIASGSYQLAIKTNKKEYKTMIVK